MNFCTFVGREDAKLALILNAIDARCGGVLFWGGKGTGKSTLARLFRDIMPEGAHFVEAPLNITEDALLGGVDIEAAFTEGRRVFQPGILSRADGGALFIDDINLLTQSVTALICDACERGEHVVEREGISARRSARFIPIAAMNPEEGALPPHFLDRFGMCVRFAGLDEGPVRIRVIKTASEDGRASGRDADGADLKALRLVIARAAAKAGTVSLSREVEEQIVSRCVEAGAEGHRGEVFVLYAARAYAAYCGDAAVAGKHVDAVAPLVLAHRARPQEEVEEQAAAQDHKEDHEQDDHNDGRREEGAQSQSTGEPERDAEGQTADASADGTEQAGSRPKEEVFGTGEPFCVKRIAFAEDRLKRSDSGRRSKTASSGKSGRYVKSGFHDNRDVAVDATLRAAAPFQKARGRQGVVVIKPEDLRFKEREKKMGHLVVFVVDGSGSMGAQRRMVETKGAVQSLLLDCYRKRDKVAFIVFRRDRAEVVLPPTSSLERAAKRLRELPVGGRTPLSAGLLEAYRLVRRNRLQRPLVRCLVVLVTDGRANQGLTAEPVENEIGKLAALLSGLKGTDYMVVDVEDKKSLTKMDLAVRLAQRMGARYFRPADLKSDSLTGMVLEAKAAQLGND
jgi:magnesium chelatase subunit D